MKESIYPTPARICNLCHYHAPVCNRCEQALIKILASIVKTSKEKMTKNGKE